MTMATLFNTSAVASASTASIQGLGHLVPNAVWSQAFGVSNDRKVIVGQSDSPSGYLEAFRWTSTDGITGLGSSAIIATDVSSDGSVVVGSGDSDVAFRWTADKGKIDLGGIPGSSISSSFAHAVSADGSVIVGESAGTAFYWTSSGGMIGLGNVAGGDFTSTYAWDVSADGSVVVGYGYLPPNAPLFTPKEAFRWTPEEGMVGLGDLPGGIFNSDARGVSADGTVIVGESNSATGSEAFRWTPEEGMVGLGSLPGGGFNTSATATSADGSVIVGNGRFAGSAIEEAFVWDQTNGIRLLKDVLIEGGASLGGWTQLTHAYNISADGTTIVGRGVRNGRVEAFAATIVPEPTTLGLTVVCGFALLRNRSD